MARIGLANAATIDDLARIARRRVPRMALGYLEGGAGRERAVERNCMALDEIVLAPRYMRDVGQRSTATSLFGRDYALPIGISPVGLANAIQPGADRALAMAARGANVPYGLSTVGTTSIEDGARLAGGFMWFQLYVSRDEETTLDMMRRALNAGVEVLQVTIDVPVQSRRVRDIRNRFQLPFRPGVGMALDMLAHPRWALAAAMAGMPRFETLARYAPKGAGAPSLAHYVAEHISGALSLPLLKRLRDAWPHSFVVKGVLDEEAALEALALGADGIIVSNHGGRQFDAAPAAISMLPAIADAVGERMTVMMDSGVRSGEDVLRALCLGADYVFSGRAFLYGALAGGGAGVEKAFAIFQDEISRGMAQLGVSDIAQIKGSLRASPSAKALSGSDKPPAPEFPSQSAQQGDAAMTDQPLREIVMKLHDYELPTFPRVNIHYLATAPGNEHLLRFMTEAPNDPTRFKGKRIGIIATHGVEETEVTIPRSWFEARGATCHIVSPNHIDYPVALGIQFPEIARTHILAVQFTHNSGWIAVDARIEAVTPEDYDAVYVPGGAWNPDQLRTNPAVLAFLQAFQASGKPLGALCHGSQVFLSAKLTKGRQATGYWAMMEDLANAGATVRDEPVVVDDNVITSRFIYDIPQFVDALVARLN